MALNWAKPSYGRCCLGLEQLLSKAESAALGMEREVGKGPGFIGSCLAALCCVRLPTHLTDEESSPT